MLDSDINACLGDFRLVRPLEKEKATYAEVEGVPYIAQNVLTWCVHARVCTLFVCMCACVRACVLRVVKKKLNDFMFYTGHSKFQSQP